MIQNKLPYYSLNTYLKETFGKKVYKLALDGGMTCPNRDGTLGTGGCIFCSKGGSGDFAVHRAGTAAAIRPQLEEAKQKVRGKTGANAGYIAYFQSYTNTYAPAARLEELFTEAILQPDIVALSIATRPDCLPDEVIALLQKLNRIKPVWIELGLQTIHPDTAAMIRRGYPLSCFEDSLSRLKHAGITVIVHVILGLPGETRPMMLDTVSYLAAVGRTQAAGIDGIKLQLLHILKETELNRLYQENPFPVFSLDEYVDLLIDAVALLPEDIVIHRLTGDGPKSLLIAPLWSADKRLVLNTITRRFRERGITQGCRYSV